MNRTERTRILIENGQHEALEFASQVINSHEVEIIFEPKEVLVMVKLRESARNSLCYLGEVLASEAMVRVEGKAGLGLVKGHHFELALALALIDGAYEAKLALSDDWDKVLVGLGQQLRDRQTLAACHLARSAVNFEMMVD